jgi:hypothetical protein
LTDVGTLEDGCKIVKPLPKDTVAVKELWKWTASGAKSEYKQVVATPVVARFKKGETPTVVAVGGAACDGSVWQAAHLFGIDGANGDQKWASDAEVKAGLPPALGDLDGDGTMDIVALGMDNKVRAFDHVGKERWASESKVWTDAAALGRLWPQGISIADLDGDGTVEVVAGYRDFAGKDGAELFTVGAADEFGIVAETDGKAGLEIVTGRGIYSGKGKELCTFATRLQDPAAARLEAKDKTATVIGVDMGNAKIIGYDGASCAERFSVAKGLSGGGPINVADFDGDGVLDFGTAGRDTYAAFKGPKGDKLWTAATQDKTSEVTGSTTFDFNGDGKNEVVYSDELKLRIFDGSSGRLVYEGEASSYTARESPAIADVDADGEANIVTASNTCPGSSGSFAGVRAFRSADGSWVGTRTIWSQQGYDPLQIRSNGRVTDVDPEKIWKPWLKSAHLAGFRNNIPMPKLKKECR